MSELKEYIEREAVMHMINYWADGYSYIEVPTEWAEDVVRKIPTVDAVPVVRCQDCQWRPRNMGEGIFAEHLDFHRDSDGDAVCPYAVDDPWYNKEPHPYGFCHLGDREEDQHDN